MHAPVIDQPRVYGPDLLRAFACLLVLFCHLAQRVNFANADASLQWLQPLANGGNYGVVIFFVLSGFLLSWPRWR